MHRCTQFDVADGNNPDELPVLVHWKDADVII
jgi:hypothetical protein